MAAQKKVLLIQSRDKLEECLFDVSRKWVSLLGLPPMDGRTDPQLQEMKHYVDNNRRIVRIQHDPNIQLGSEDEEAPWYTVSNICQELTKMARRMLKQVDLSSGESVSFIMTSLLPSPSPYYPTLALYQEDQLMNNRFCIPDTPSNLRLKLDLKRASGVVLEWDVKSECVTHFMLQFKKISDPGDWLSACTLNASNTFLELKNLKDASGHQFRVASVSLIGRSEFSAVFEVHVPTVKNCPPPANLKTGLVTHNSIELLWDSPELRDTNVEMLIGYDLFCSHQQPSIIRIAPNGVSCRLDNLVKGTEYNLEVSADYGSDGRSSAISIRVTTLAQTNRLIDVLRRHSQKLPSQTGLDIYSLPLTQSPTLDDTKIRRFVFGQPSSAAVLESAQVVNLFIF